MSAAGSACLVLVCRWGNSANLAISILGNATNARYLSQKARTRRSKLLSGYRRHCNKKRAYMSGESACFRRSVRVRSSYSKFYNSDDALQISPRRRCHRSYCFSLCLYTKAECCRRRTSSDQDVGYRQWHMVHRAREVGSVYLHAIVRSLYGYHVNSGQ